MGKTISKALQDEIRWAFYSGEYETMEAIAKDLGISPKTVSKYAPRDFDGEIIWHKPKKAKWWRDEDLAYIIGLIRGRPEAAKVFARYRDRCYWQIRASLGLRLPAKIVEKFINQHEDIIQGEALHQAARAMKLWEEGKRPSFMNAGYYGALHVREFVKELNYLGQRNGRKFYASVWNAGGDGGLDWALYGGGASMAIGADEFSLSRFLEKFGIKPEQTEVQREMSLGLHKDFIRMLAWYAEVLAAHIVLGTYESDMWTPTIEKATKKPSPEVELLLTERILLEPPAWLKRILDLGEYNALDLNARLCEEDEDNIMLWPDVTAYLRHVNDLHSQLFDIIIANKTTKRKPLALWAMIQADVFLKALIYYTEKALGVKYEVNPPDKADEDESKDDLEIELLRAKLNRKKAEKRAKAIINWLRGKDDERPEDDTSS